MIIQSLRDSCYEPESSPKHEHNNNIIFDFLSVCTLTGGKKISQRVHEKFDKENRWLIIWSNVWVMK